MQIDRRLIDVINKKTYNIMYYGKSMWRQLYY